jgi:SAM-dependent methyltransferase
VPDRAQDRDSESPFGWIREVIRARGFFGTLRFYAVGVIELLRDLTPSRRKSRYGDIDFDFEHNVDTTWATVSLRTRLREWLRGVQYQPSEPDLFRTIIESLPAVEGFTFIDLGSGKGRTLLMASAYPFQRIIGLELLEELNATAVGNIARYKSATQRCFAIESHAGDARHFDFPAAPTVLYLFNPFPEHVLREVLANLHRSVLTSPRPVHLIYHNLAHEAVFDEQHWLRRLRRTHQFAMYEAEERH